MTPDIYGGVSLFTIVLKKKSNYVVVGDGNRESTSSQYFWECLHWFEIAFWAAKSFKKMVTYSRRYTNVAKNVSKDNIHFSNHTKQGAFKNK